MKLYRHTLEVNQFRFLNITNFLSVLICAISFVFMLMFAGCGPVPTSEFNNPETTTPTAGETTQLQTKNSAVKLPLSAKVDLQKHPYLRRTFNNPTNVRNRLALANFHLRMREIGQHSAILSKCSLDVLKAFVAKGWAPIVLVQLGNRTPFIAAVVQYDDSSSMVHLQNPIDISKRRLTYDVFEKSWGKSNQKRCVLITPNRLTEADVDGVLAQFLDTNAYQNITMDSH